MASRNKCWWSRGSANVNRYATHGRPHLRHQVTRFLPVGTEESSHAQRIIAQTCTTGNDNQATLPGGVRLAEPSRRRVAMFCAR